MRIFFFFLIALFAINFEADAIEVECKFTGSSDNYACEVKSIKLASNEDRELTRVTGAHKSGYSNDNVEYYTQSVVTELKFFPQGITKFFKNVRNVFIHHAKITSITKEDLKPFGQQLKEFYLGPSELEVIDADLFDYTQNLEKIYLHNNKIKHVSSGAFNNLPKLTTLWFSSNPCTFSSDYAWHRAGVINLIAIVESQCQDLEALERHRNLYTTTTEVPTHGQP